MSESSKRPNLTMDQVMEIISEIARNDEGPDRFRALKMITDMQRQADTPLLPAPTSEEEVMERGARIFTGLGEVRCNILMRKCFRHPMSRNPNSGMWTKGQNPKKKTPPPEKATDGLDAESS